jgi:hypothetical protein
MRKLALIALPALLAPMAIFATSTAAHASIGSSCYDDECGVNETMGNGYCNATVVQTNSDDGGAIPSGTFAEAMYTDTDTGYKCDFWFERNVRNTGWYRVGGVTVLGSGPSDGSNQVDLGPYYNGGGYQAQVCFQFDWGSSLGAVHCSPSAVYEG